MASIRPGGQRLLAAGFGVAPSITRHTEQPPLSRALQRVASFSSRAIKDVNRFFIATSSSSSASNALAIAALALATLSLLSIKAGLPASVVFFLLSATAASSLVAWRRSRNGSSAANNLSVPPSLGMSSTSSLLAGSPARKANLLSASNPSSAPSLSSTPTKGGSGGASRMVSVVVDAGCRTPEITAAE